MLELFITAICSLAGFIIGNYVDYPVLGAVVGGLFGLIISIFPAVILEIIEVIAGIFT